MKDKLFHAIGGTEDELLERSDKKTKKVHWLRWGIMAACIAIVACVSVGMLTKDNSDIDTAHNLPPAIVLDGTKYIVSSSDTSVTECPDGFEYSGLIDEHHTDDEYLIGRKYFTNESIPEWIYIYCEVWDRNNDSSMAYVRFVYEDIRGSDFIRYNGKIYVSMWSDFYTGDQSCVDYHDDMRERYGIRVEADIVKDSVLVGEAHFEEKDRIPQTELGVDDKRYNGSKVYEIPDDNQVLYVGTSWYTATTEEDGETLHTGYDVFVLYDYNEGD